METLGCFDLEVEIDIETKRSVFCVDHFLVNAPFLGEKEDLLRVTQGPGLEREDR